MSEEKKNKRKKISGKFLSEKFQINSAKSFLITILYSFITIGLYLLFSLIPQLYTVVGLFRFGLILPLVLIPTIGAIRGPLAGFITGYIGTLLTDLVLYRVVLVFTIPYIPFGLLGFIVGFANYQLNNGKSLVKLAIFSTLTFLLSILLSTAISLTLQNVSLLVVVAFATLPLLTMGLPSIFLLTPLYCRLWYIIAYNAYPSLLNLINKLKSREE